MQIFNVDRRVNKSSHARGKLYFIRSARYDTQTALAFSIGGSISMPRALSDSLSVDGVPATVRLGCMLAPNAVGEDEDGGVVKFGRNYRQWCVYINNGDRGSRLKQGKSTSYAGLNLPHGWDRDVPHFKKLLYYPPVYSKDVLGRKRLVDTITFDALLCTYGEGVHKCFKMSNFQPSLFTGVSVAYSVKHCNRLFTSICDDDPYRVERIRALIAIVGLYNFVNATGVDPTTMQPYKRKHESEPEPARELVALLPVPKTTEGLIEKLDDIDADMVDRGYNYLVQTKQLTPDVFIEYMKHKRESGK